FLLRFVFHLFVTSVFPGLLFFFPVLSSPPSSSPCHASLLHSPSQILLPLPGGSMPKSAAKTASLYDVHPGVAMVQKWIADLKPKTGRSLDEWIALLKKDGPKDYHPRRAWLKSKHKLGANSAWWIAERAEGKGGEE